MSIEAIKQALEYVYNGSNNQGPFTGISWRNVSNAVEPAIAICEQTLSDKVKQPTQDALVSALYSKIDYLRGKIELLESGLVQAKRTWRGLTDEERRETINRAWNEYVRGSVGGDSFSWCLSQAIEAKLKEKNQ